MNIWIEARVAKRIFGSVRAVGERFQGPIYAALAMASRGDVVQVSGPLIAELLVTSYFFKLKEQCRGFAGPVWIPELANKI